MWEKNVAVSHLICGCKILAQKEYKRRHDNITRVVHWKPFTGYNFDRVSKWLQHQPEGGNCNRVSKSYGFEEIIISGHRRRSKLNENDQ